MTFITKVNLARQGKLSSGEVANLYGSINLGENLTVSGNTYFQGITQNLGSTSLLALDGNKQLFSYPIDGLQVPTFQSVTDIGNFSTNGIQFIGSGGIDLNKNGVFLTNNGVFGITNGGVPNTLNYNSGNTQLGYLASIFTLQNETNINAGSVFNTRISGKNAINANEYVTLSQISGSTNYSFSNGLRKSGSTVKLGLDLSDPTYTSGVLTEDLYLYNILDLSTNNVNGIVISESEGVVLRSSRSLPSDGSTPNAQISVDSNGNSFIAKLFVNKGVNKEVEISANHDEDSNISSARVIVGSSGLFLNQIGFNPEINDFIFNDSFGFGLKYNNNYFSKGSLNDRWIPDLGAVKQLISGATNPIPDASTTTKGIIKLAGDLAGTADLPTVPALLLKAPIESPEFTGLPLVPTPILGDISKKIANTEFINQALGNKENVSSKTNTVSNGRSVVLYTSERAVFDALLPKAEDSTVVHKTGNEDIGGIKSFKGGLTNFLHTYHNGTSAWEDLVDIGKVITDYSGVDIQKQTDQGTKILWNSIQYRNTLSTNNYTLKINFPSTLLSNTTLTLPTTSGRLALVSEIPSIIGDASITTKGIIKLAGDLAGTADLPTVPGLANKANTNGFNASGTWGINITGNAATANNSINWNGLSYSSASGIPNNYLMSYQGNNTFGVADPDQVRVFLNIPTGGDDLQSITDRNNSTTRAINSIGGFTTGNGTISNIFSYEPTQGVVGTQSAHPFKIRAGGVDHVTLLTNGNVGIGTTTPSEKLEVTGNVKINAGNVSAPNAPTASSHLVPKSYADALGVLGTDGNSIARRDESGSLFANFFNSPQAANNLVTEVPVSLYGNVTGQAYHYAFGAPQIRTFLGLGSSAYTTALSLTTSGSGAAAFNSGTGVLNIPTPDLSLYVDKSTNQNIDGIKSFKGGLTEFIYTSHNGSSTWVAPSIQGGSIIDNTGLNIYTLNNVGLKLLWNSIQYSNIVSTNQYTLKINFPTILLSNTTLTLPTTSGRLALASEIPSISNLVDKSTNQNNIAGDKEWTGFHNFRESITIGPSSGNKATYSNTSIVNDNGTFQLPLESGIIGYLPIQDSTLTGTQTSASLNTAFPLASVGQTVTAKNVGTGMKYEKINNIGGGQWITWAVSTI